MTTRTRIKINGTQAGGVTIRRTGPATYEGMIAVKGLPLSYVNGQTRREVIDRAREKLR